MRDERRERLADRLLVLDARVVTNRLDREHPPHRARNHLRRLTRLPLRRIGDDAVLADGEVDRLHRPIPHARLHRKTLAFRFDQDLDARRRHEGTGAARCRQRAASSVVPAADLRDLDRRESVEVEADRGVVIRGGVLGNEAAFPHREQEVAAVDVAPAANVVATAVVRIHVRMSGRIDHEPTGAFEGFAAIRILVASRDPQQGVPHDGGSTHSVTDGNHASPPSPSLDQRVGIVVGRRDPVDALIRPLRLGRSFLSLQQEGDGREDRGVDVRGFDRRRIDFGGRRRPRRFSPDRRGHPGFAGRLVGLAGGGRGEEGHQEAGGDGVAHASDPTGFPAPRTDDHPSPPAERSTLQASAASSSRVGAKRWTYMSSA